MTCVEPPNHYDVAVIGAGVFGAWTAYQLRSSGARTVLIDAYGPGNSRSSSGDESRIIRMGYGADEVYTRSALRSLTLWKNLFEDSGEPLFHQTGVLWLAHEGDPYPRFTRETLQRVGVRVESLTTGELKVRYPQFEFEGVSSALFEPDSGVIQARRAVQLVVRAAVQRGVEYLQDAVLPLDRLKPSEIVTGGGRHISAQKLIFACGPWLPKLFPDFLSQRIRPTRQEVFYFGAPAGDSRFSAPALPAWIDFKEEAYGLPDIDSRGIKIAIDRHGAAFDPDTSDRIASREGLSEVRNCLARRLPDLRDAPLIESRVCQYENTWNGDFLIDRHPELNNVWWVGGGSGHGFKHGPAVGEYVAKIITGVNEGFEPRFSLATKKFESQRAVF